MSWLFSQALVAEYSAGICSDGEPCALWNSMPTQRPSWLPAKTTAACRLSRSGMTFEPLTDTRGEAVLTSFLEAFPVRTSAQPEREQASPASAAGSGSTWRGLSVKFDPASCGWKTAHSLFPEDSIPCSPTLPPWGMMRDGELLERTTPGLRTEGNGFGYWPTPRAYESTEGIETIAARKAKNGHAQINLTAAVKMWPTPDTCAGGDGPSQERRSSPRLQTMVKYPTAKAGHMCGGSGSFARINALEADGTITAEEAQAMGSGGQLNPDWVEWLMCWPCGWTSMEGLGNEEFKRWKESCTAADPGSGLLRVVWWHNDPAETSHRPESNEQHAIEHPDALRQLPREPSCLGSLAGSQQGAAMPELWGSVPIREGKAENLQSEMREPSSVEATVPRVANDVKNRVDRLRCIGNGQVSAVVRLAWETLTK